MIPLKLGVLASGRGSNFEAILENIKNGKLKADVQVVISNKVDAGVLDIARANNIPAVHLSAKAYPDQDKFDEELLKVLVDHDVNFVVLAGYLKMISSKIVRHFENRILNIHPALLPSFGGTGYYGSKVHQAVLDYGCKVTGVTVHLVDEKYDHGTPILQRCVPVLEGDTAEILAHRVLETEHQLFTEALQLFAEGCVEIQGRKVILRPR
jgi:phosphoribosylglycinamide formyltransferase 1